MKDEYDDDSPDITIYGEPIDMFIEYRAHLADGQQRDGRDTWHSMQSLKAFL